MDITEVRARTAGIAETPDRAEPSACRHCGIAKGDHFQRWHPDVGWHKHAPPTDAQILSRMRARRAR